jgi:hypothetical protein
MKQLFRRPSPAMVVAVIALIAGLSGTAIGASVLGKKQVVKISKKQANKVFTERSGPPLHYYIRSARFDPSPDGPEVLSAFCDPGDHAIAGGYDFGQSHDIFPPPPQNTIPLTYRDTPFVLTHQIGGPPELGRYWNVSLSFANGGETVYAVCLSDPTARFN